MAQDFDREMANNIAGMKDTNRLIDVNNQQQVQYKTTLEQNKSALAATAAGMNAMMASAVILGLASEETRETTIKLAAGLVILSGILALYQGYRLAVQLYTQREVALSAIETAAHAAVGNIAGIAIATAAAASVPAAFLAGREIGRRSRTSHTIEADINTPAGRRKMQADVGRV